MSYVLAIYFGFGLFLATFYDTWLIAVGVGGICLIAYFVTRALLPDSPLSHYVISVVFAVFSAQFIYQMHGLFEMHFMFFVGSTLLITYRNWKLILPLLLLTVVQHAWFAWLQYSGFKEIYFTQLDYMTLQAFLFHAGLAGVIMGICGFWSYDLEQYTLQDAYKNVMLERQVAHVSSNISFAESITKGDLNVDYAADQKDELGKSLIKMRDSLRTSLEREEEEKFITVGITKVSEIIRQHGHDPVALADEFISGLVKYTGLNQGALFVQEESGSESYLKLAACYAYDRKKFIERKVGLGEGLVGQCFLERDSIYLTAVPRDYIKITSGLGQAVPQCVYIVPVKTGEEITGVIELASFNLLREFEKEFIMRAAENIASAILSSRTTERIKLLLADSEQRAEEMRSQEEEMRQNMEELQATQEEMARKQSDHEARLEAMNASGIVSVEFDLHGQILSANDAFRKLMGYRQGELEGRSHQIFVNEADTSASARLFEELRKGIAKHGTFKRVKRSGHAIQFAGSYNVLTDANGVPQKVLWLAIDITGLKQNSDNGTYASLSVN